ncbi:MAG: hypothetical protein SFX73_09725 [Kofleriaceae bacterium]|nr:hypothetical protein [Kofleriaceae bacterium]
MWVGFALACVAACHEGTGTSAQARERVLARIDDDATVVIAAQGRALSHPHVRAVIDVLRPRWPARMGCAIDAMFTAEDVAVGIAPRGTTVVIETTAQVTCPTLSNVGGRLWVATIGDSTTAGTASVLDDERRARAKAYLLTAPLVATLELAGGSAIATARPEPLEAWFAFDTTLALAPLVETRLKAYLDTLANRPVTGPFVQRIEVTRQGSQVVARMAGPVDADLAVAVRLALSEVGTSTPDEVKGLPCPPRVAPVRSCDPGPAFRVTALADAVAPILAAPLLPVIENTRVRGLRLGAAVPALGLEANDILIGVDGRPAIDRAQLSEILRRARGRVAIVVERDRHTSTVSLVEP